MAVEFFSAVEEAQLNEETDLDNFRADFLDELGGALRMSDLRDRIVSINGHTDFDGEEDFNLRLSLDRALAVKQYLENNHAIA